MQDHTIEVICRYLQDAIAAESGCEARFRTFSEEGDDAEVQGVFAEHVQQTSSQITRLGNRLEALSGDKPGKAKSLIAQVFNPTPRLSLLTHSPEERLTQNLISAYSIEMSECAMYEALRTVAGLAGDDATAQLAAEIGAEERETALRLWHFLPSRSKIAFNVATPGDIDPSVETRASADRLV